MVDHNTSQIPLSYDDIVELNQTGIALSAEKNPLRLQEMILRSALKITHADGGTLYVLGDDNKLHFKILITQSRQVHKGGTTEEEIDLPPIELYRNNGEPNIRTVAAYAALSGKSVNIADIRKTQEFDFSGTFFYDQHNHYESQSFLTIPLRNHESKLIAVLQLINSIHPETGKVVPFSVIHQHLAESLASQAAIALTNNLLVTELGGLLEKYIGLYREITQNRHREELIYYKATHDSLTGLANRSFLNDTLHHLAAQAERSSRRFALIMIDLDGFKQVNDTLGHDAGDTLLKKLASRLKQCVRKVDTMARLGGDEFTMLIEMTDTSSGYLELLTEKLLSQLSAPVMIGDQSTHVSASIGIAFYPENACSVEELQKRADQAMYAAKRQGKNRVCYFMPEMQKAANLRKRTIDELDRALADNQFQLYYQPVFSLTEPRISKAEALLRWNHPSKGLLRPRDFILISEETGRINQIGDWVLAQVSQDVQQWSQYPDLQISINIAGSQLQEPSEQFLDIVRQLNEQQLTCNLVLELTEKLLLEHGDWVAKCLSMFQDAQIEVALDDFGTSFSSLSNLQQFHIDYLKIDHSFISMLDTDNNSRPLCEAIVAMAHKLDIQVIAEGIENKKQLEILKAMQCDFGQGFFFSQPVPAPIFKQLIAEYQQGSVETN